MKKFIAFVLTLAWIGSVPSFTYGQRFQFPGAQQSTSQRTPDYDQGFRQGEWDARNNQSMSINPPRWMTQQERREYEAGYQAGYYQTQASPQTPAQDRLVYRQGIRDGRRDAQQGLRENPQLDRWRYESDRQDYLSGYQRGYQLHSQQQTQEDDIYGLTTPSTSPALAVDRNGKTVSWHAGNLPNARVFVKEDRRPEKLFAESPRGTQEAPWLQTGHRYTFILRDLNGRELTREEVDLRQPSWWRGFFGN